MHCHERISKEHSHALVDLVAESSHGVQVVVGEGSCQCRRMLAAPGRVGRLAGVDPLRFEAMRRR